MECNLIWNHMYDFNARVRFEITSMTKIAPHEVQLPLYYSHFEIAEGLLILYIEWKWCDLKQKWRNLEHAGGAGGRDAMFSQLAKRSSCVAVSG